MEKIMETQTSIDKLILKTRQYEFADGLRDIQIGLIVSFMGIVTWLVINPLWITFIIELKVNVGRWAMVAATLMLFGFLAGVAFGLQYLMNYLRQGWFWRESGMVKASRRVASSRTQLIAGGIFIIGLVTGLGLWPLVGGDEWYIARILYSAMGWGYGAFFIIFGRDIELPRYIWLGLIGGLASTLILFFPLDLGQSGMAFGVGWGVLLSSSGIVVLRRAWASLQETDHVG
jgi:hypothetical protein